MASKETNVALKKVPYIYYPLCFEKNITDIRALINSGSEVNAMITVFGAKLNLRVYSTNVEAQKINGSTFKIFRIVLASFQIENKFKKA